MKKQKLKTTEMVLNMKDDMARDVLSQIDGHINEKVSKSVKKAGPEADLSQLRNDVQEQFEHCEHRLQNEVSEIEKRLESQIAFMVQNQTSQDNNFVSSELLEQELESLRHQTEVAINQSNEFVSAEVAKAREDSMNMAQQVKQETVQEIQNDLVEQL